MRSTRRRAHPEAANQVGQPPQVHVRETVLRAVPERLRVTPLSITLYAFALERFSI